MVARLLEASSSVGRRRAAKGLRRAGWAVNNKRVQRLWRDEGLQVPTKKRKQRLYGIGTHVGAMSPIRPNALWALDFQYDHTIDGHQVKLLNVIDEFTRSRDRASRPFRGRKDDRYK